MRTDWLVPGVFALLLLAGPVFADAADDQKERDRLGLTQEEWETCKVLKLSPGKVRELLSSGITLDEYSGSPWLAAGISEEQWISKRRQGMKDIDIKQMEKAEDIPEQGRGLIAASFFLPGYGHFKLDKKPHGFLFAGVSLTTATLFLAHKKSVQMNSGIEKNFRFEYFVLWLANSIVCSADVWRRTRFIDNPDLERFSLLTGFDRVGLRADFPF